MNALQIPDDTPRRIARTVLAVLTAALLAGTAAPAAQASHQTPCANDQITDAVAEVTGVTPLGDVCNPRLYGDGQWDTYAELRSEVAATMNACGNDSRWRRLTQAVIHVSGIVPRGASCAAEVYRRSVDDRHNYTLTDTIDWSRYEGNATHTVWAPYDAIYSTLYGCSRPALSLALIETTGHYPNDGQATTLPNAQTNGECRPWMYRNAELSDWGTIVTAVQERKDSALVCSNVQITQAINDLSGGFNPIGSSGTTGECDPLRYGGSWSSLSDLKTRVEGAWRCRDPWIGIAYRYGLSRNPKGFGTSGECNPYLYGNGSWSGYDDLLANVRQTNGALAAGGIEIRSDGELLKTIGGVTIAIPPEEVYIGNATAGIISTGGGNLLSDKGLGVINMNGGSLTSLAGGSIISTGGGNIIAAGGGNIISTGGGNIISTGGGNALGAGLVN